jgi:hypothetical protein
MVVGFAVAESQGESGMRITGWLPSPAAVNVAEPVARVVDPTVAVSVTFRVVGERVSWTAGRDTAIPVVRKGAVLGACT